MRPWTIRGPAASWPRPLRNASRALLRKLRLSQSSRPIQRQSGSCWNKVTFDNLTYTYAGQTNRLTGIADAAGANGYTPGTGSYTRHGVVWENYRAASVVLGNPQNVDAAYAKRGAGVPR